MQWLDSPLAEETILTLAADLRSSTVLSRLLVARGIRDYNAACDFLQPNLQSIGDPFAVTNLSEAAARLDEAVRTGQTISIFGDYDVDGVTSTVILVKLLRMFGVAPRFYVPLRLEEGYGLSERLIDRAFADGVPDLVFAVDCGTNAVDPIRRLREAGCDVVVVDHHQLQDEAPAECILVNPHVNDTALESCHWRDLCSVGLVFKLMHGFLKHRRSAGDPVAEGIRLSEFLDLVALGTIADLVPLEQENRLLAWYGLRHLKKNRRAGVRALAQVSGMDLERPFISSDIAFKLGPRINASGRLDDACRPIEMLLEEDFPRCLELANDLNRRNRERQGIERAISEAAERQVESDFADDPGFVLFDPEWHPGVVGIVASRIARRFHRPCLVLGAEGSEAKGSGRSVEGVDLVSVLGPVAGLLSHWGGHPMAVGLSLPALAVDELRTAFIDALRRGHPDGVPEPALPISAWIELCDLDENLMDEIERLQPFGQGNPEPIFGLRGVSLPKAPRSMGKGHARFSLVNSRDEAVPFLVWRGTPVPPATNLVDLAFQLSWNFWQGRRLLQATLRDWRYHQPVSGQAGFADAPAV